MENQDSVPVATRLKVWGAAVTVGIAAYFMFAGILTTTTGAEQADVAGKIAVVSTMPAGARPGLAALLSRQGELRRENRARHGWSAFIGLTACVGFFALGSVYWRTRGAQEAAAAAAATS